MVRCANSGKFRHASVRLSCALCRFIRNTQIAVYYNQLFVYAGFNDTSATPFMNHTQSSNYSRNVALTLFVVVIVLLALVAARFLYV